MLPKVGLIVGALATILSSAYGGYRFSYNTAQETFGKWPYASLEFAQMIAQYSVRDLYSKQTALQFEISRLQQKCGQPRIIDRGGKTIQGCDDFERNALSNYIREWQENQRYLERVEGQQRLPPSAQQQQQFQMR